VRAGPESAFNWIRDVTCERPGVASEGERLYPNPARKKERAGKLEIRSSKSEPFGFGSFEPVSNFENRVADFNLAHFARNFAVTPAKPREKN
jgi:hypothetical protein